MYLLTCFRRLFDYSSLDFQIIGAYRITYVSDDDVDGFDELHQTRKQLRSLSLDSFDKFCRSGSMSKEDRHRNRSQTGEEDDDDGDNGFVRRELNAVSPAAETIEGNQKLNI